MTQPTEPEPDELDLDLETVQDLELEGGGEAVLGGGKPISGTPCNQAPSINAGQGCGT